MKTNKQGDGMALFLVVVALFMVSILILLGSPAHAADATLPQDSPQALDAMPSIPTPILPEAKAGAKFNSEDKTWTIASEYCWLMFSYSDSDHLFFVCKVEGLKL